MNRDKIEQAVWELQAEIWKSRNSLWAKADLPPAHRMCTPEIAAKVLGVQYELHPSLGSFGNGVNRYEVAGLIDRQRGIAISQKPDYRVQLFTGGHEVGHWVLHKSGMVMHRDRAVPGIGAAKILRPLEEREADYFSACYRVSRNMLRAAFESRFGPINEFRFSDDDAFGLSPNNPRSLMTSTEDSLEWELALSRAIRFQGHFFESLTEMFLVSDNTMAFRLQEVGLRRI